MPWSLQACLAPTNACAQFLSRELSAAQAHHSSWQFPPLSHWIPMRGMLSNQRYKAPALPWGHSLIHGIVHSFPRPLLAATPMRLETPTNRRSMPPVALLPWEVRALALPPREAPTATDVVRGARRAPTSVTGVVVQVDSLRCIPFTPPQGAPAAPNQAAVARAR